MRQAISVITLSLVFAVVLGAGAVRAGDTPQRGDLNCDGSSNAVDSLVLLRFDAGLSVNQTQPCAVIGSVDAGLTFGDINCDSSVGVIDSLFILRADAGLAAMPNCADVGIIPREVQGVEIISESHAGTEFVEPGSTLAETLTAMGKSPSDMTMTTGLPADPGALDFQMGVQTIAGVDAGEMLEAFANDLATATSGDIVFEQVTVGGKTATRGTAVIDPSIAPVYYSTVTDDTLVFVQSPNLAAVEEVFADLPAAAAAASSGVIATGASERSISISVISQPEHKICVGYPPEPYHVQVHYTNPILRGAVPMPFYEATATATKGTIDPGFASGKTFYGFDYDPESRGSDTIVIDVEVTDRWIGQQTKNINAEVHLCLSGDWQDGSRVLRVIHSGAGVRAEIISGTLICGVQGKAFSGNLSGNILSGSDLLACNPEGCENLPQTVELPFEGIVSDDGEVIGISWESQQYEDDEENPGQCNPTTIEQRNFTIDRLTFTDPRP